jgi:superoxide dismutase, Fe-Mn family
MSLRKVVCGFGVAALLTVITAMQMQPKQASIVELVNAETWPFTLPPLPFDFTALEPDIDAKTVDIHYSRHHKAYVDALNKAVSGTPYQKTKLEELFKQASKLSAPIRNNAGGHWNHTFYWSILRSPVNNPGPSPKLVEALAKNFGSFDAFKAKFREAGLTDFGSGWSWLVRLPDGTLTVYASHNQDNPLMDISEVQGVPLLACDVWEHAYYLKYLNRRDQYMDNFWNLVNWQQVEESLNQK